MSSSYISRSLISAIVAALCVCASSSSEDVPKAKISNGLLKGKYLTSRNGNQYEAFLGIRFATVPARFEHSVPDTSTWDGVKEATEYAPPCTQKVPGLQLLGQEDCLYLNVFTPKVDDKKRPVIVYIHGGGFNWGETSAFGASYFMDEGVVLVTITYRLGLLGFLRTGDGVVTGNMGLRDQVMALKWVQENVEAFGGDPSRVTIQGESAGSASVNLLLLSPLAKGLFHKAVAHSGTATNPWAFRENTLSNTVAVGEKLGCNAGESWPELLACFRNSTSEDLFEAQFSLHKWHSDPIVQFPATLETRTEQNPEPFLDRTPSDILKSGDFNRVPLLQTMTKDEGIMFNAAVVLRTDPLKKELNEEWDRVAPITFLYDDIPGFSGHVSQISKELRKFYFGANDITLDQEQNLVNLYTDSWFLKGIHDTTLQVAKHVPVFLGLFTHVRKDWTILSFTGINEILGVSHGEDIAYLFNAPDAESPFCMKDVADADDVEVSKTFVKMVASFAKTGNPETGSAQSPEWTSVSETEITSGQLNWFNVGLEPYLHINPFKSRMKFWDTIYKKQSLTSVKTEL